MIGYSFICLLVFAVTYTEKEIDLCGLHGVVIRLIPARLKCDRGRVFFVFLFVCLFGWLVGRLLVVDWLVGWLCDVVFEGVYSSFFHLFFFMAW